MSDNITPLSYSVTNAAKALDVSRSTVYNLIASGQIVALKMGTRTIVTAEELKRYLGTLPKAEIHWGRDCST